ncbi:hypothetical protein ACFL50_06760 [Candidatus Latescibacterota bacterium]
MALFNVQFELKNGKVNILSVAPEGKTLRCEGDELRKYPLDKVIEIIDVDMVLLRQEGDEDDPCIVHNGRLYCW